MAHRIIVLTVVLTLAGISLAQADPIAVASPGKLQQSIARINANQLRLDALQSRRPPARRRGSAKQRMFAAIGAFAGMVAGGYVGVKIEGDRCRCDDPGLAGFIIGAPIGAIVGGVVGYKLGR